MGFKLSGFAFPGKNGVTGKKQSKMGDSSPLKKSYETAYGEQSDEKKASQTLDQFKTEAKEYNNKTYGTESPTARADKAGMTKPELREMVTTSKATPKTIKAEAPKQIASAKNANAKLEIGSPKAKTTSKASTGAGSGMGGAQAEQGKIADIKSAPAEKAPAKAAKAAGGTRTATTAKDGSKTITRGGRTVKTVDADGNKTRYNRKGEETAGSKRRGNKKADRATAETEKEASIARRTAEKESSSAARGEKVAEKKSNDRAEEKVSNDAKTAKYLASNKKTRDDNKREASKLREASGGKLSRGEARRSVKSDNKRVAAAAATKAAAEKKASETKAMASIEKAHNPRGL